MFTGEKVVLVEMGHIPLLGGCCPLGEHCPERACQLAGTTVLRMKPPCSQANGPGFISWPESWCHTNPNVSVRAHFRPHSQGRQRRRPTVAFHAPLPQIIRGRQASSTPAPLLPSRFYGEWTWPWACLCVLWRLKTVLWSALLFYVHEGQTLPMPSSLRPVTTHGLSIPHWGLNPVTPLEWEPYFCLSQTLGNWHASALPSLAPMGFLTWPGSQPRSPVLTPWRHRSWTPSSSLLSLDSFAVMILLCPRGTRSLELFVYSLVWFSPSSSSCPAGRTAGLHSSFISKQSWQSLFTGHDHHRCCHSDSADRQQTVWGQKEGELLLLFRRAPALEQDQGLTTLTGA